LRRFGRRYEIGSRRDASFSSPSAEEHVKDEILSCGTIVHEDSSGAALSSNTSVIAVPSLA
jgi:hypothetical protein